MPGMNRVILVGRLTKDCELRKTKTGMAVVQFTLAVDRQLSKEQKQSGQHPADFITCIAWKQRAEFLGNYGKKGDLMAVEGKIQTRSYKNQRGETVYVTEVLCDNAQILSSRSHDAQAPSTQPAQQISSETGQSNNQQYTQGVEALDIDSSDLPF